MTRALQPAGVFRTQTKCSIRVEPVETIRRGLAGSKEPFDELRANGRGRALFSVRVEPVETIRHGLTGFEEPFDELSANGPDHARFVWRGSSQAPMTTTRDGPDG